MPSISTTTLLGGTQAPNWQGAFSDLGGAVSDLFQSSADQAKSTAYQFDAQAAQTAKQAYLLKSQGDILEGQQYGQAASLADLNAQYTAQSTAIQTAQADRALFLGMGEQRSDIAASGGTEGGSAGDILRSSASQGALNRAVLSQQGLITEAGYTEQAQSYRTMQSAAGLASQEDILAAQGEDIATQKDLAASRAASQASQGDIISGAIKSAASLAALFLV